MIQLPLSHARRGLEVSLEINTLFSDPGAVARDTHDGNLTVSITDGGLDTATEGSYILTYTATDAAGNAASVKRTVNVNWSVPVIVKESDVTDLGSGYYASTWFGPSFPEDINWLYSPVLGWLYVVGNDTDSLGSMIRPKAGSGRTSMPIPTFTLNLVPHGSMSGWILLSLDGYGIRVLKAGSQNSQKTANSFPFFRLKPCRGLPT